MAIKVYSETFLVLYNAIENDLRKRFDPVGLRRFRKNDRSIWDEKCPVTGKKMFKLVFPNTEYAFGFNEKKSSHKNSNDGYKYEPSGTMSDAFKFLGFKVDENLSLQIDEDTEAQILYQFFLERYCKEFYKKNIDELQVYDETTGDIINRQSQLVEVNTNKTDSVNAIDDKAELPTKDELLVLDIKQLVDKYIECITTKDFDKIFSLFGKKQKKKMGDNPKYISDLFRYTLSISDVNIFKTGYYNFEYAEALIYYTEKKEILNLKNSSNDGLIEFADNTDYIGLLSHQYKQFEKELNKQGMDWPGQLRVEDLFHEDFISYLWGKSLNDPDHLEKIFSSERKQKYFHRLYKFNFEKIENSWIIANIESINAPAFIDEFRLYFINPYVPLKESKLKRLLVLIAEGLQNVLNRIWG